MTRGRIDQIRPLFIGSVRHGPSRRFLSGAPAGNPSHFRFHIALATWANAASMHRLHPRGCPVIPTLEELPMRIIKLFLCASLFAAVTAGAATLTKNPRSYAVGADISGAFTGVTLTRLVNLSGTVGYAPTQNPVIVGNCGYAACLLFDNAHTIGPNTYEAVDHRVCYNANQAGFSVPECGSPYALLQVTFATPTDFVEFHWTALSDPPLMTAYNAAGAEISVCQPFGGNSCITTHTFSPGGEKMGTIRISTKSTAIKKVVVGSSGAATRLYMMQYNVPAPPCVLCP
jgi:hypothetical protein